MSGVLEARSYRPDPETGGPDASDIVDPIPAHLDLALALGVRGIVLVDDDRLGRESGLRSQ